jgi:two-component system chemotaxis sensor kinase CheA
MYSSWNGKGTMDNTCMEDQEMIHEFLIESYENLSRLDQDLVELEKHPKDALLLGSIFRTIHTIKGACGFLAFSILEGITHQAESILSQLRDGERELTPALVSLILETVDATRKVLASIEESGTEGSLLFEDLTNKLRAEAESTLEHENGPAVDEPVAVVSNGPTGEPLPYIQPSPLYQESQQVMEQRAGERRAGEERRDEEVSQHSAAVDSNIRVGVGLLDKLMDLVGELVLTRNQILQFNTELRLSCRKVS